MKVTYQYRFYPDTNQKLTLNQWLRICRYWYNRQLGDRFDWWEMNRTAVNACPLIASMYVTFSRGETDREPQPSLAASGGSLAPN